MIRNVTIKNSELLSDNWYILKKITYDFTDAAGNQKTHIREVYDRGNGAAILLYNKEQKTVILTRQFRLPTFINGNEDGMMIEACAGLLDKDNPEDCIRRETEEETGFAVTDIQKVMEPYMSPGSVTEILYLFIAAYDHSMRVSGGGGLEHEQENIEVLELPFKEAMNMIKDGSIKDAKTIMLLQYLKLNEIL